MYAATQFLGRYSVWEDLFPNVFTKAIRKQVLGNNKWVSDLYQFFLNNRELILKPPKVISFMKYMVHLHLQHLYVRQY